MRTEARIERLAKAMAERIPAALGPPAEIWQPDNGRGDRPPGRYPLPGANAVLVIYEVDTEGRGVATTDSSRSPLR